MPLALLGAPFVAWVPLAFWVPGCPSRLPELLGAPFVHLGAPRPSWVPLLVTWVPLVLLGAPFRFWVPPAF